MNRVRASADPLIAGAALAGILAHFTITPTWPLLAVLALGGLAAIIGAISTAARRGIIVKDPASPTARMPGRCPGCRLISRRGSSASSRATTCIPKNGEG